MAGTSPAMTKKRVIFERSEIAAPLLQLIGHLIEPGLDACLILFAAWRTRCAGCADDVIPHLDWKRTLVGDDVAQVNQGERRIGLQPIGQRARWRAERARGVGFAEAVLEGV